MTEAELANHIWWGWFWTTIEHGAFVALIVALAVEFAALKLAEPHKKVVDDAKDLKIAELQQIAPRILSAPDQEIIREKLKPLGPLVARVGTTQSLRHSFDIDSLDAQIAGLLALAEWKALGGTTWGTLDRPVGVTVSSREGDENAGTAADVLVSELNAAGIVAHKDPKPFAGPKHPRPPEPPPLPPDVPFSDPRVLLRRSALDRLRDWQLLPDIQVIVGTKP